MSRSPRRPCPVCKRPIAVVAGLIWRHDPPREQRAGLTSCDGSWERPADPMPGQTALDVGTGDGGVVPIQDGLF